MMLEHSVQGTRLYFQELALYFSFEHFMKEHAMMLIGNKICTFSIHEHGLKNIITLDMYWKKK